MSLSKPTQPDCKEQEEKAQIILNRAVERIIELGYKVEVEPTIAHNGKTINRFVVKKVGQ